MWWHQLGIRHDRIAPGKPQQNGRLERLHRTLAELAREPAHDVRAQQRAMDHFRHDYNQVRPHEALGQAPPLSAYEPSRRRYPRPLEHFDDVDGEAQLRVDRHGYVRWERRRVLISAAFAHEVVKLDDDDHDRLEVRWGPILLGWLDGSRLDRGLILPARRRR